MEELTREQSYQEMVCRLQAAEGKGIGGGGVNQQGKDERHYKIQTGEVTQATAAIPRLCLGHTTLGTLLHCLCPSPDPFCPWYRTTPETTEHFLLHSPHFHSRKIQRGSCGVG
ncbi:hypothetical protein E2C01_074022 [Portunus trituberculatus]|uniref:Uncharacterized protein n=1 Tax=Portunus trituberculatus TaxID=210409 RepID=A0A5B7IFM9_PORTR|nr:hypothetical protein [Portunus trituberculatus]